MNETIIYALLLTTFAGLSTGIGSALAFFTKKTNKAFLAISLGFSGGVMIYVSFVDILVKAIESLEQVYSESTAAWYGVGAFFLGIIIIMIIDRFIPSFENPHEPKQIEDMNAPKDDKKLYRMGLFTALAIGIHNFPEGIATFSAYLVDPSIGIPIAIAIAIHNIPEGIAVSIPVYYSTGSRKKAFWLSFSSGLSEPVGAIIGYMILHTILTPATFGFLFAAVGGIMVFISVDELLPTAREYDHGHKAIYGMIAGMAVMAFSILIMM